MISHLSHTPIYVLNQDSAKDFYTRVLGFEVRSDVVMGEGFDGAGAGFRWLTVGPRDQPGVELILADCSMGRDPEAAQKLRDLVSGGTMGAGVMATDNCRATCDELRSRGVTFIQEPADRPYGIEAVFRDDSGNWFTLTQRLTG